VRVWQAALAADPLPWLLEEDAPVARHLALRLLLDRPADDAEAREASARAMSADPIAGILAAQRPEGYWEKPGPGYGSKYRGTIWQVIALDQLGADPADRRVRAACEYVLAHSLAESGGFGASGSRAATRPPPSAVIHCLNGNLLRALIGLGCLEDARVRRAIDWQAGSITGEGFEPATDARGHGRGLLSGGASAGRDAPAVRRRYYATGTSGPGFACAANERLPCGWGAVKAMLALARVPTGRRDAGVRRAIQQGAEFLLSRDPAVADYPAGWGNQRPSGSWFKLGTPIGYVADVLQNLEALCELGHGADPRLGRALAWLLARQDRAGRWTNQYAYNGKTWVDLERQGEPGKLVTIRACRVLRLAAQAGADLGALDRPDRA
jgi:hypothetical protein